MFRVHLNKSHCRILIKTLDIHRLIIRGEINKISPLIMENKKPQISSGYDNEESFNIRVNKISSILKEFEEEHISRYLNVLQLMPRSIHITNTKKKLYNLLPFLSGDLSDCLSVNFSSDEIFVLSLSLKLYYSLLCGRVEILHELFEGMNVNFSTILLVEKLRSNRDLFTNLIDNEISFDISSNYIYYKAKWAWDIYNVLEGKEIKKLGSIPLIKIEAK
jgi:hypothetical protein